MKNQKYLRYGEEGPKLKLHFFSMETFSKIPYLLQLIRTTEGKIAKRGMET